MKNTTSYSPYLTALGLTENEASVYETLLTLGAQTASKLSIATSIPRTLLYNVLEKLIALALVTRDDTTKVAMFTAAAPDTLTALAEKKKRESEEALLALTNISPQLRNLHALATGKPGVQYFEGMDGVQKCLESVLTSRTEVKSYADISAIEKHMPDLDRWYSKQRTDRSVFQRNISADTQENRFALEGYFSSVTKERLVPMSNPNFNTVMHIYDNKVSYFTLGVSPLISIIITDPHIYEMHTNLFESLWNTPNAFSVST
jgi:HTH-type transcriptional regulator, sugar sensing transcriptional regulator